MESEMKLRVYSKVNWPVRGTVIAEIFTYVSCDDTSTSEPWVLNIQILLFPRWRINLYAQNVRIACASEDLKAALSFYSGFVHFYTHTLAGLFSDSH